MIWQKIANCRKTQMPSMLCAFATHNHPCVILKLRQMADCSILFLIIVVSKSIFKKSLQMILLFKIHLFCSSDV